MVTIEVGLVRGDTWAEMERRLCAGPAGVFPLRLAGQPVAAPGLLAKPGTIVPRVLPGDLDEQPSAPAPPRSSAGEPIRKRPAGMTTINGQSVPVFSRSRKVCPGFEVTTGSP
jgi:hypothetical protein